MDVETVEEQKLRSSIVPYLVAGEWLQRQGIYRAYALYNFVQVFAMGAAGIGFGANVFSAMAEVGASPPSDSTREVWGYYGGVGTVALLLWIGLWAYLTVGNGQHVAGGIRSCSRQIRAKSHDLMKLASKPAGVAELNQVLLGLQEIADRAILEGSWPEKWTPFPQSKEFAAACDNRYLEMCRQLQLSKTPLDSRSARRPREGQNVQP